MRSPAGPSAGTAPGGAAQSKDGLHPAQRDPEPARAQSEQVEEERPGSGGGGGPVEGEATADSESKAGGSLLTLSEAEVEKIRSDILSYSIAAPEPPGFELRLGKVVPATVPLRPLPPELKRTVPNHENYSYLRTPNRIALVITGKREIDYLIPV